MLTTARGDKGRNVGGQSAFAARGLRGTRLLEL